MGFFDVRCLASGLPIRSGQPCRAVIVQKRGARFAPVALAIEGRYDKLGSLEDIRGNEDTKRLTSLFGSLWREKRLSGGSPNQPLARPKNPGHLLEMIRQGAADQSWIKADGSALAFALIDDGIFRAAVEEGRAPAMPGIRGAFGDAALAAELYGELPSSGLNARLRDFAKFRAWFGPNPWTPDLGGELYFLDDIETAAAKALRRFRKHPLLLRALEAHLAGAREEFAAETVEEFLESWLEERGEDFIRRWKIDEREFPEPVRRTSALPVPRPGDVVLGMRPGEVRTLDEAIRNVRSGGRILVRQGVYEHRKTITARKPFTLSGEGMHRSVLVFGSGDDGLVLEGKEKWRLEHVALISTFGNKYPGGDTLLGAGGASVEGVRCLFGGARGVTKRRITTGGVGARAMDGARMLLRECHLAFCGWGACSQDSGRLTLEACRSYGCDLGVGTFKGGGTRAIRCVFESNGRGANTYGGPEVTLDLENCRIEKSWGAGLYAEQGSMNLTGCRLLENGGHGLASEAGTEVMVRRCLASGNRRSGFRVGGKATLERCNARGNAEHGIELCPGSEGRVSGCRCLKNGRSPIARDSK
jgi:hypothetical protein